MQIVVNMFFRPKAALNYQHYGSVTLVCVTKRTRFGSRVYKDFFSIRKEYVAIVMNKMNPYHVNVAILICQNSEKSFESLL